MKHCLERFEKIRMVAMDVDGTLTDGKIYMGPQGEVMKAFHVRDGYRLAQCPQHGIITAIITGRASEIVARRTQKLHICEVHQMPTLLCAGRPIMSAPPKAGKAP